MADRKSFTPFIAIADDEEMRRNILLGTKQITIREGERDIQPGYAIIGDHIVSWIVRVTVTDVRYCTVRTVTREEWEADGFTSQEHLLTELQKYYPTLSLDSPVTVIRWNNVEGELVDDFREFYN